jgi:hypothetical protein
MRLDDKSWPIASSNSLNPSEARRLRERVTWYSQVLVGKVITIKTLMQPRDYLCARTTPHIICVGRPNLKSESCSEPWYEITSASEPPTSHRRGELAARKSVIRRPLGNAVPSARLIRRHKRATVSGRAVHFSMVFIWTIGVWTVCVWTISDLVSHLHLYRAQPDAFSWTLFRPCRASALISRASVPRCRQGFGSPRRCPTLPAVRFRGLRENKYLTRKIENIVGRYE